MQILVNRERIDFSLEDESSVGEVVDELAEWLRSGRFAITSLDIDEAAFAIHERAAWEHIGIEDVHELSIEALPLDIADHATLIALDEYLGMLSFALERRETGALPELAEELPFVRARIAQFFPSLLDDDGTLPLLMNTELGGGRMPTPATAEAVLSELADLRAIIVGREREYRLPCQELALTLGQLTASIPSLVEVPVQLQTGKESAAMQTIIRLTELLTRVVRLVPLAEQAPDTQDVDLSGVRSFAQDIGPHLLELKDALEAQDTVLIGDLLEYEIAPRLERLDELVPEDRE